MHPRLLVLAIAVATFVCLGLGAGQEDWTARRLAHVARDLRLSAGELYGKGTAASAWADVDTLWDQVRRQYTDVFGADRAKQALSTSDRSIKALEERTYEILKALWGRDWVKATRSPP